MAHIKRKSEVRKVSVFQNISKSDGAKKADLLPGTWIWYEDPELICVPAQIVKTDGSKVTLRLFDDDQPDPMYREDDIIQVDAAQLEGCSAADASHLDGVPNMIHLGDFHLGAILHNLVVRLRKKQIYTHIGNILVAMNPYESLPLYTEEQMAAYMKFVPEIRVGPEGGRVGYEDDLPPHIFQVAKAAFTEMVELSQNQSIIISGESGAGKTETTKFILRFLAEYTCHGELSTVEKQILESSPILESFGNATTLRNNNSSRFGKWTEIFFDAHGRISGAKIQNYLLEKVRVVRPTKGERSFHIFYYLCAGATAAASTGSTDPIWAELKLGGAASYKFLNQAGALLKVNGIDDLKEFKHVDEALKVFNMSDSDRTDVFRLLAAILHLGNVEFVDDGNDGSRVADACKEELGVVCQLLGLNAAAFEKAVCFRIIGAGTQAEITKPRTPAQACNARDGLAKMIYSELFDWIVNRLNESIADQNNQDGADLHRGGSKFIGVLDIYGFEVFETNSFEQLCINYANEKLQQHFNRFIFKEEQRAAAQEDIDFAGVEFEDNQHTLDLFEETDGIFPMLDQSLLMNSNDRAFLGNLNNIVKNKRGYFEPKTVQDSFGVHHYAGDVVYSVNSFIEKNRDTIDAELISLLQRGRPFLSSMFTTEEFVAMTGSAGGSRQLQSASLGKRYQTQLRDLMTVIEGTVPHFVRCVKPNSLKRPRHVEALLTTQQLKYAGFLEAIRIRRLGYPVRRPFAAFVHRYAVLAPDRVSRRRADLRESCVAILERVKDKLNVGPPLGVQVGIRRVFLKQEHMDVLEDERQKALMGMVMTIQKRARARAACFGFKERLSVHRRIQAMLVMKPRDHDAVKDLVQQASKLKLSNAVVDRITKLLADADACMAQLASAQKAFDLSHLREVLGKAAELGLASRAIEDAQTFQQRVEKMQTDLDHSLEKQHLDLLESALRSCRDLKYSSPKVEQATVLRDRLRKEMPLDDALKRAIASQKRVDLETALEQADSLGYQSAAVDDARMLLAKLQQRDRVKAEIVQGIASRDLEQLEAALTQARGLGLASDKTVQEGEREVVTLRGEWEVRKALKAAMVGEDAGVLRECITNAEQIGIDASELAAARAVWEELLKKSGVLDDLRRAISSRRRVDLEDAIAKAEAAKLDNTDDLQRAQAALAKVIAEEDCIRAVDSAINEKSLEKLERAVAAMEAADMAGERVNTANETLRAWRAAFQLLDEALTTRKLVTIQLALSRANAVGLFGVAAVREVEHLETLVEREGWAVNQLKLAMSKRSLDRLNEALAACRSVGVSEDRPEMHEANALVAEIMSETKQSLESATSALHAKEIEIEGFKQRLAHSNDRATELQNEKDALKQKLEEIQAQLSSAQGQIQDKERSGRSMSESLERIGAEKIATLSQLTIAQSQVEALGQRVSQLEKENGSLKSELSATSDKLLAESAKVKAQATEIQELTTRNKQEADKISTLHEELSKAKGEIEVASQQLTYANSLVAELTQAKAKLDSKLEELSAVVKDRDVTVSNLQSQLMQEKEKGIESQLTRAQLQGEAEKQAARIETALQAKTLELEASEQRLAISKEQAAELMAQRADLRTQKTELETKLNEAMARCTQIQSEAMQCREKELGTQAKLARVELEFEAEQRKVSAANDKIQGLQLELATANGQLANAKQDLEAEKASVAQFSTQLRDSQTKLKELEALRDSLQSQIAEHVSEKANQKAQITESLQKIERFEQQAAALSTKLEEASKQRDAEAAQALETKLSLEKLIQQEKDKATALQTKLDKKQAEMDQLTLNMHVLNARATAVEEECESLKQAVAEKIQSEQRVKMSTPSIQGWLRKQGGVFNSVKRRYFVLKADCLFYYETADVADKPLGVVPLLGVEIRMIGKKSQGYGFEILPSGGNKVMSSKRVSTGAMVQGSHTSFVLFAETESACDEWSKALNASIQDNTTDVEHRKSIRPTHVVPPREHNTPSSALLEVPDS